MVLSLDYLLKHVKKQRQKVKIKNILMGQKSNTITLRKSKLRYLFLGESTKNVMFFIKYYKLMKNLFRLRGLNVTNFSLNRVNKKIFVTFSLFYNLSKIISYQRIFSKKIKNLRKKR